MAGMAKSHVMLALMEAQGLQWYSAAHVMSCFVPAAKFYTYMYNIVLPFRITLPISHYGSTCILW